MKSSIRNRLFLITYAIILAFIVGLIVLNNTYLDKYYTNYRERTLLDAFEEVKTVDLTSQTLDTQVFDIENSYNISIHILKELPAAVENPDGSVTNLPIPYERIYGNEFSIHDSVIANIMLAFNSQLEGTADILVDPIDIPGADDSYIAYLANIVPNSIGGQQNNNDFQMRALLVAQPQSDGLYLYYILTVTIQSIQDSIAIFNSFTILVGFLFMILSGLVILFTSSRFTKPILEINAIAEDIANLNFSKRVTLTTDDELGTLGKSINIMSDKLESSIAELKAANERLSEDILLKTKIDEMRKEFIASASHELKTPISVIMGYSEALKLSGLTKQTSDEYLDIIIDESNKMNKLVMGLLKLSQIEGGFLEANPTHFSVKDLVDETTRLFSISFANQGVHLNVDVQDETIFSDYDQLQTVLQNYIANALHHVDKEKQIRIASQKLENGDIRISVFNSGHPIAESDLSRIWESFYKVDKARTRSYGGQGLGLSIVKNTLDNLGYAYGVTNAEGGVTFFADLHNLTVKRESGQS